MLAVAQSLEASAARGRLKAEGMRPKNLDARGMLPLRARDTYIHECKT
jgi:hypothetical protein